MAGYGSRRLNCSDATQRRRWRAKQKFKQQAFESNDHAEHLWMMIRPDRRRKSDHPAWAFARLALVMVPVTGVLWLNASKFDWTEHKSIIELFLMLGGWEGVRLLKGK